MKISLHIAASLHPGVILIEITGEEPENVWARVSIGEIGRYTYFIEFFSNFGDMKGQRG